MSKADYVRSEAARNVTFDHHCHWPGCERKVPPAMWERERYWRGIREPYRQMARAVVAARLEAVGEKG